MTTQKGFTLIELLIVIAIIGAITALVLLAINPAKIIEDTNYKTTIANLNQISKAAQMYEAETGKIPPDANRNIPTEFMQYLGPGIWPNGPFDGSVYDWDNWLDNRGCWDGTHGGVQITLRDIKSYKGVKYSYTIPNPTNPSARELINVNGQPELAIYMVVYGNGIPHCSIAQTVGICINCESTHPPPNP